MKKVAFVLGGALKGDTLHSAMFLKSLVDVEVSWIHGVYHRDVVKLLRREKSLHIKKLVGGRELCGVGSYDHIELFAREIVIKDFWKYDICYNGKWTIFPEQRFHIHSNDNFQDLDFGFERKNENVGLQISSVHSEYYQIDKSVKELREIKVELPLLTFGLKDDMLCENGIDKRGIPLLEVVEAMMTCKLFIGIHSFLSWLAFYLGIPVIVCHFMQGLVKFSDYHSNCVDLIRPSLVEIESEVKRLLD